MTATLNTQIRYEGGYITPVETLEDSVEVEDAELVEANCRGWGESNAVVRYEGGYYLATIEETTRVRVYYTGTFGESGLDGVAMTIGADIRSSVDGCNSDGTGVACVDCPADTLTDLRRMLDESDAVESYA